MGGEDSGKFDGEWTVDHAYINYFCERGLSTSNQFGAPLAGEISLPKKYKILKIKLFLKISAEVYDYVFSTILKLKTSW